MARPRVPELVGVLNLIARLVGFAISLVLLGIIIYEAARWGGPKTYWLTYLTVSTGSTGHHHHHPPLTRLSPASLASRPLSSPTGRSAGGRIPVAAVSISSADRYIATHQVAAALIVDAWDVAAIADRTRRVPRSPPGCLISEDLLVMCLATPSLVLVAINSSNIAEGLINDAPWADADLWTCILTVLVL